MGPILSLVPQDLKPAATNMFDGSSDLFFVYQPIVDVCNREVFAYEALVRSRFQSTDLLLATIISEKERLDFWQFTLKRTMAEFIKSKSNAKLSINFSQADISKSWFVNCLFEAIEATGFDKSKLIVELTEKEAMFDQEKAEQSLVALSKSGISIALDDFGISHGNMDALCFMPISEIKIDGKFTMNLENEKCINWIKQMVSFSEKMGISLIVEIVETQRQVDILKGLGVTLMQGFYFAEGVIDIQCEKLIEKIYGGNIGEKMLNHNVIVHSLGLAGAAN